MNENNKYVTYLEFVLETDQVIEKLQFNLLSLVGKGKAHADTQYLIKLITEIQNKSDSIDVPNAFEEAHQLFTESLTLFQELIHFISTDKEYDTRKFDFHFSNYHKMKEKVHEKITLISSSMM